MSGGEGDVAAEFGAVHVVSAPGNHGRNSKKPRSKRRSANNADTLIEILMHRDPKARVILGLSREAEQGGIEQDDGSVLVPLTREDLAAQVQALSAL